MSNQDSNTGVFADGRGRSLLSVNDLAKRWGCSTRHIRRMADAGRIPQPLKLGNLIRWSVAQIERWESDGCPSVRSISKEGRR